MRYNLTLILFCLFFSCTTTIEEKENVDTKVLSTNLLLNDTNVSLIRESSITHSLLPFFNVTFNKNDGFEEFYYDLLKDCINKDTTAVLNAIYDTLRYSRYECAYGLYINSNDCDGCTRCSKKGMLDGVFSGLNSEQICTKLYELISYYGIGLLKNNKLYNKWLKLDNAYSNFNFKDWNVGNNYFNYGLLIPKQDSLVVRASPKLNSKIIKTLPFKIITYSNEPGMGILDEEKGVYWLAYNGGYINGKKVLSGFDYTLVIFEKTSLGWKITGFMQPPGC